MNTFLRTLALGVSVWGFMDTTALAATHGPSETEDMSGPADKESIIAAVYPIPTTQRYAHLTAAHNLVFDEAEAGNTIAEAGEAAAAAAGH